MSNTVWNAENGWHDGPEVKVGIDQRGRVVATGNEKMTFDGRPVKAVHIEVTVDMVSFVFADYPDDTITWERPDPTPDQKVPLRERIGHEIVDALEYRSHHLTDSEDGDGLIAPYQRPQIVAIKVVDQENVSGVDVESIVEGMSGEL